MTIRVLLVDDQPLLRTGFRLILATEPDIEVVGEAGDGVTAQSQVAALRPDVVLMDIRMPRMDGVEATRGIVDAHGDAIRVLVLTTYDLDEYIIEALRAGASGFLLKDTPAEALVDAVRVVHQGDAVVGPSITRRLLDRYAKHLPASREAPASPVATELTQRERDVLLLLARGLSNAEIAASLVVSETTVKSHVSSLLGKLGLRDRVQAVIYAYQHGLVKPA
ncbi:MAG TPA: response regulator transcription factor [Nocardioidaceae bacterium]|nr:response regulator transcription factor [Nocardioidaceae bacterium]